MLTALSAKNKVEFFDGTITQPAPNHVLFSVWKRFNNMVISWLVHSVSISIRQSILWMDNAIDIWKDLKVRYSQGDLLRISDLQQELASIRQGGANITDYFTKLRMIWDELESYRPALFCTCDVKCSCNALTDVMLRKMQDRIMQFLRGLNEQYHNVRSNILMMDPLPSIAKVFSYVVQQERQLTNSDIVGNLNAINAASSLSSRTNYSCSYCGREGHTVESCYKKNGRSGKVCTHCGFNGHIVEECYKKHGYPPGHILHKTSGAYINNTVRDENNPQEGNDKVKQENQNQDMRLTPQQYQILMSSLQQHNGGTSTNASHINQIGNIFSLTCNMNKNNSDFWILDSKPASTPIDYDTHLHQQSGVPLSDSEASTYRRLIGRLIYLTNTRPDITFVVQHRSQFTSKPRSAHQHAAAHILRYVKAAPGSGIFFSCLDTRRSITGFSIYLGSSLISWKSQKQATVSRSSFEVEYQALANATCELQWLTYLLEDFGVSFLCPAFLYCDNQSTLHIAANPMFHERTKHIELDCHLVREKLHSGLLKLLPITSANQLANIYTKALPPSAFNFLQCKLGMYNIHSQLEGGS
uniref:Copia protein n=1 Tax=Cajanus cajan TaxID=3821 RepID=A0A151TXX9_CAJCA|nr:Copia protein [Cajanus cajan]